MVTWGAFRRIRPDLAEAGRALLYQFGVGLAFLATTSLDGGPRTHPVCPVLVGDGLFGLLIPSPKRDDLVRDGRFALHTFPAEDNEDAFYITGIASRRPEPELWATVTAALLEERGWTDPPPDLDSQHLFEYSIHRCLLTRTAGHGDPAPVHTVWHAPESDAAAPEPDAAQ